MNRFETFEERQVGEEWEMNMHLHPLDQETEEIINRHKQILTCANDDFVAFVHHIENQRKQ